MDLILTKEQKHYLDNHSPMNAKTLQRVFKKSVEDQQKILDQAEKILTKQRKAK